jgi:putative endonuclease
MTFAGIFIEVFGSCENRVVTPLGSPLSISITMRQYYVYIMTNDSRTLYVGMTNNLERRVFEHKNHLLAGFTSKYKITKLVYFEETGDVTAALAREKQIKGWLRQKKVALIESVNSNWQDLSAAWEQ